MPGAASPGPGPGKRRGEPLSDGDADADLPPPPPLAAAPDAERPAVAGPPLLPAELRSGSGPAAVLLIGAAYITVSAGLIHFNKYLMHQDRFPYALPLVTFHMVFCSLCSSLAFFVRPSLFPSLADPTRVGELRRLAPWLVVIGLFFALALVFSNIAYMGASVAFLQMMKEGNVALVYLMSVVLGLDQFTWTKGAVIAAICLATTTTVHGEVHFSAGAFGAQVASQLFETVKLILQSFVLSGAGKLDPLSYVLVVSPICALLLGGFLTTLLAASVESTLFRMPTWSVFVAWLPVLIANAALAMSVNVIMAIFIRYTSALAIVLSGLVKDAAIVLSGRSFLGEEVSRLQAAGFSTQLILIFVWAQVRQLEDSKAAQPPLPLTNAKGRKASAAATYGTADRDR